MSEQWVQFLMLVGPVVGGALASQLAPLFKTWRTSKGDDASRLFEMSTELLEKHREETDRLREDVQALRKQNEECETDRAELHKAIDSLRADLTRLQARYRGMNVDDEPKRRDAG